MLTYAQAAITQMGVGYGGGPRMTRTYVHAMEQVLSLLALLVQRCSGTCFTRAKKYDGGSRVTRMCMRMEQSVSVFLIEV